MGDVPILRVGIPSPAWFQMIRQAIQVQATEAGLYPFWHTGAIRRQASRLRL